MGSDHPAAPPRGCHRPSSTGRWAPKHGATARLARTIAPPSTGAVTGYRAVHWGARGRTTTVVGDRAPTPPGLGRGCGGGPQRRRSPRWTDAAGAALTKGPLVTTDQHHRQRPRRGAHRPWDPQRPRRVRYGQRRQQVAELWLPDGRSLRGSTTSDTTHGDTTDSESVAGSSTGSGTETRSPDGRPCPVVVLLHGGYWRAPFTKRLMRSVARDVARRGWAALNVEYRRVGLGGGGGGWPATFDDVADAVDHVARLPELDPTCVVLCGHSAGGQLALWVAGRHRLPPGHEGARTAGHRPAVTLRGVVSVAGVVDLAAAVRGTGAEPVGRLLGGRLDLLDSASPFALLPLGVPQALVHGDADTVVPLSMSQRYARAAVDAGDDAVVDVVPGAGHRDVLSAASATWAAVVTHLERWLDR